MFIASLKLWPFQCEKVRLLRIWPIFLKQRVRDCTGCVLKRKMCWHNYQTIKWYINIYCPHCMPMWHMYIYILPCQLSPTQRFTMIRFPVTNLKLEIFFFICFTKHFIPFVLCHQVESGKSVKKHKYQFINTHQKDTHQQRPKVCLLTIVVQQSSFLLKHSFVYVIYMCRAIFISMQLLCWLMVYIALMSTVQEHTGGHSRRQILPYMHAQKSIAWLWEKLVRKGNFWVLLVLYLLNMIHKFSFKGPIFFTLCNSCGSCPLVR